MTLGHAHHFALELEGVEVAHFAGCTGLSGRSAVIEIAEGGLNDRKHRFAGATTWGQIVLTVGVTASPAVFAWRDEFLRGDLDARKTGAIVVYDEAGEEMRRYSADAIWPVSWAGPELSGTSSGMAIETLELAHEGLREEGSGR